MTAKSNGKLPAGGPPAYAIFAKWLGESTLQATNLPARRPGFPTPNFFRSEFRRSTHRFHKSLANAWHRKLSHRRLAARIPTRRETEAPKEVGSGALSGSIGLVLTSINIHIVTGHLW